MNSINKFLRLDAKKHYPSEGKACLSGVIVDCNTKTGLAENINILDDTVMNGKTIFPWPEFHYDS